MNANDTLRRDFLKTLLTSLPVVALDWSAFPVNSKAATKSDQYDAIIIGSGLGGLSCAAAFARQGFKPLVLEQHSKPGGYATSFKRKDFVFDVSLHSTTVGERNNVYNFIQGFPEITDIEFVPHPDLYRTIFPDYDIRVPQKNLPGYIEILQGHFPEEKEGIAGIFADMQGLSDDISKYSRSNGQVDMSKFPAEFPHLYKNFRNTWGQMVDARITNPKLKAIISSQWGYYGLPPAKLSPYYYAMPTLGYLQQGGYYPLGRSQNISDAFVSYIEAHDGKVLLNTQVNEILLKNGMAIGVKTKNGKQFQARVIVSNACAYDTFNKMIPDKQLVQDYRNQMEKYSVSLSCFQIFLGLKKDLVGQLGIKDTEIFYNTDYDCDAAYTDMLNADMNNKGFGLTLYDNLYKGYSPAGKNTLNIMNLQGFAHWEPYQADYLQGNKKAYRAEKNRMARMLIQQVEESLLPGLSDAIEVMEIGTPLTNLLYTSNYRGAIYGWDQTLNNSGNTRVGHKTPVKNLYLAGAWTRPGHGYGAVIPSGLLCFAEIMKEWQG
ncbi:MAG TPA: NAD(P)/FAD-dependent oxidoreductase [bacterium]|mgnify:CR=1 FL=1|nr:NAD(P)/FAD-dependent oxidoreductase [bacterium]HPN44840.1 NAD(P)/FAD-dependent oxidoreductase [bacterium]